MPPLTQGLHKLFCLKSPLPQRSRNIWLVGNEHFPQDFGLIMNLKSLLITVHLHVPYCVNKSFKGWDVARVAGCLSSTHKAQGLMLSTAKQIATSAEAQGVGGEGSLHGFTPPLARKTLACCRDLNHFVYGN